MIGNKLKFTLTATTLKYIAIVAMTIDHIQHSFIPYESIMSIIMNMIGMISGPIMFYFAVEGYHHTRNIKKYLMRLAVCAIVSQIPFVYFTNGGFMTSNIISYLHFNVIYTIWLGVLAIYIRRKLKNPVIVTIILLLLIILCSSADWGALGIVIILIFDFLHGNFKKQAFGYCVITLFTLIVWSGVHIMVFSFFVEGELNLSYLDINTCIIQMGMLVPIILLSFYNGQKGKGGKFAKWFFYIFYPFHLLILGCIKMVLQ